MFKDWIGRTVTIVHSDPKKSVVGVAVSCAGESIVLKLLSDADGRLKTGQEAFCIRNPIYVKFMCTKDE